MIVFSDQATIRIRVHCSRTSLSSLILWLYNDEKPCILTSALSERITSIPRSTDTLLCTVLFTHTYRVRYCTISVLTRLELLCNNNQGYDQPHTAMVCIYVIHKYYVNMTLDQLVTLTLHIMINQNRLEVIEQRMVDKRQAQAHDREVRSICSSLSRG